MSTSEVENKRLELIELKKAHVRHMRDVHWIVNGVPVGECDDCNEFVYQGAALAWAIGKLARRQGEEQDKVSSDLGWGR